MFNSRKSAKATAVTPKANAPQPAADDADQPEGDENDAPDEDGGDEDDAGDRNPPQVDGQPADEAEAIAASAEATAHPHLALAAIKSGQSMSQFKASVAGHEAALSASPLGKRQISTLGAQMAGVPKVGGDAAAKTTNVLAANARARKASA